ncbi:serine hydrolase domain-containing protein [Niabella drilacis]|uniref:CubicO group peptidase, beta-lactamase class C family n=1 Tax=Niabella drilacis (strain DSM 25811 / CCM 8410 / CCUG 62505 / LMG 26954 / E90) TaxID=1285928 RepID=A0A1G7AL57_NIADE|nr:serine hydrolase domain-containing protein [Niabella drilacis]SDE15579.1 CubicO group peptidase, beta-lactamase class C family [Niabella drilacis]
MMKYCLLIMILAGLLRGNAYAQDSIENNLLKLMQQYQAIGLSVAVVKDNKIIYNKSFGYKNPDDKTIVRNTDIFRIASISKSFTATSLMQLVEQGRISLTDEVTRLVGFKVNNPKYPDVPITLEMILSHTSSINDKNGYFTLDAINPEKNPDWARCYNDYKPGEGYQYCNLNFNMAGAILERISGERFDQYVKNHILQPLHLYGGYVVDSLGHDRLVPLYEYNDSTKAFEAAPAAYASPKAKLAGYTRGYSTPVFSPTGGMKISALDLARYMMMHMNYGSSNGVQIISEASSKTMQTKRSDKENYGLALWSTENLINGEKMVGHTGSAYGLYSSMFFQPEKKFGFVVITNGCIPQYKKSMVALLYDVINELYNEMVK